MVKRITITLDDNEFEKWKNIKGKRSWYEFFKELIKSKEESEAIPSEILRDELRKLCIDLADLASTCPTCSREEVLLRFCSDHEKDLDVVLRVFVIVTNVLEDLLDEYRAWVVRLLKATIIEVCKGDVEAAKELLDEVCSSR
jgi:predicted CopG family antitoxin